MTADHQSISNLIIVIGTIYKQLDDQRYLKCVKTQVKLIDMPGSASQSVWLSFE